MNSKTITKEGLKTKLELHAKWLNGEENCVNLDLSNTDLSNTDLSNTDLSYANLRGQFKRYEFKRWI